MSSPAGSTPVLWLTGLPCAGKTTIARALRERLEASAQPCVSLDGDEVREHLSGGLGFSAEDRRRNIERVVYVAALLARQGTPVIVSLVSPYRSMRAAARAALTGFIEVHVRCAPAECERRDVKGMYARARRGEIQGFTGVSDPYEEPERPEIVVDTDRADVGTCVERILDHLARNELLAIDPFPSDAYLSAVFAFAQTKHRGQRRVGGKPYMTHPAAVARALSAAGCDAATVAAGLLHDVLEDTNADREDLIKAAGQEAASIVCEVTDPDKTVGWKRRKELYLERISSAGPKAACVAAADKAHNIRSLISGLRGQDAGFAAKFSADIPDKTANYANILTVLEARIPGHRLLEDYRKALEELRSLRPVGTGRTEGVAR
ncbi:MAG: Adenylyl-sulfate kinase [Candidatus Omnitrophica bacterium]|nr:Adenylyl-sulfate kinase [Candidatus Omnitrophota bacterium]